MIRIANIRTLALLDNEVGFYVGKPIRFTIQGLIKHPCLANPFEMSIYDRQTSARLYKDWLYEQISDGNTKVVEALDDIMKAHKIHNVVLVCWCWPLKCHAEVIREYIKREETKRLDIEAFYTFEEERLYNQKMADSQFERGF